MTKQNCIASLSASLNATSRWRSTLDGRWPDHRNSRAARLLAELAADAANLSDECYAELAPFVGSECWGECLRQAARVIGFARRRMSLQYFVRSLVRLLSAPATTA